MINKYKALDFNFKDAAIYKIVVRGEIATDRSDRFWGLQVNVQKGKDQKSISFLVGQIADQSALSGILTRLNDLHMTVISVNMLSEIESA